MLRHMLLLTFVVSSFMHPLYANFFEEENKLNIYENSSRFTHSGYNDCNMIKNGEYNLLKNFLRSDFVVFDVGANKGDWSKLALKVEPKLHLFAFEPIPSIFTVLQMNFRSNNLHLINLAVSDSSEIVDFYYYDQLQQNSELSGLYYRPVVDNLLSYSPVKIKVQTITLDNFCEENNISNIDFLKIDTEGAEWNVLQGSKKLISQKIIRAIQFEYGGAYKDSHTTLKEVYLFLKQYGYKIYRIIPNGLVHIDCWDNSLENYKYCNYFAILQEEL